MALGHGNIVGFWRNRVRLTGGDLVGAKNIGGFTTAGALAFGAAAAHASIAAPSSGNSDAILFAEVVNAAGTAPVASYAGDTGISINSIIGGSSGSTTVLGSDLNLIRLFAADGPGDTIEFAVLGGQYSGSPNIINFQNAGVAQFLTTTFNNSTASISAATTGSLTKMAGLDTDVSTINFNSGGAIASKMTSDLEGTAELSALGLTLTQYFYLVPLPAASWLLGSALPGVLALSRRKPID